MLRGKYYNRNSVLESYRRFDEIYKEINGLRSRIDVIERAATAYVEDKKYSSTVYTTMLIYSHRVPCGELTTQNFKMLKRIHHELSLTAKHNDVVASFDQMNHEHAAHIQQLRTETAPLSLAKTLQSSLSDLHRQVQHVEDHLVDKVDKAEINHLEVLSEQLQHHLHRHNILVHDISTLQQQFNNAREAIDCNSTIISTHTSHISQLQQNSGKYSAKIEVRALAKEIAKLESELKLLASETSVSQVIFLLLIFGI